MSSEIDSVVYMNDVKITGGSVFRWKNFRTQVALCSWQQTLVITYQGKLKVPQKNCSFAVKNLSDQTIIQGVLLNKTNQPFVFFSSEEPTFDLSHFRG